MPFHKTAVFKCQVSDIPQPCTKPTMYLAISRTDVISVSIDVLLSRHPDIITDH